MLVMEHFALRARDCENQGASFTATLMRLLFKNVHCDTKTGSLLLNWPADPHDDALALRVCSALHQLALEGYCEELTKLFPPNNYTIEELDLVVSKVLDKYDCWIAKRLCLVPQTNEVNRSAILVAALARISRETSLPLEVVELGSSAGLNLLFEEFKYNFSNVKSGKLDSKLCISPEMRGAIPNMKAVPKILKIMGCDIAPIDVQSEEDRGRLLSYVWPDQAARIERLSEALTIANKNPPKLMKMSAEEFIDRILANRTGNSCLVVFHSIFWQYIPLEVKVSIEKSLNDWGGIADTSNPIAWVQIEGNGEAEALVDTSITFWPEKRFVNFAESDFHANWINFY